MVKDETGVCRFTFWDKEVDKVEKERAMNLEEWLFVKLSIGNFFPLHWKICLLNKIDDIGPVLDADNDDETSIQIGKIAEQLL